MGGGASCDLVVYQDLIGQTQRQFHPLGIGARTIQKIEISATLTMLLCTGRHSYSYNRNYFTFVEKAVRDKS